MRYDACVIGAGADGLAAAILLARAGLKAVVVEKSEHAGGRCALREFHPGFRAAPFTDSLPAMPAEIYRALGLAQRGVFLAPSPSSLALWPDRTHWIHGHRRSPARDLFGDAARAAGAARLRAAHDAEPPPRKPLLGRAPPPAPWPDDTRFMAALADLAGDGDAAAHVMARVLEGRAADPFQRGSALHLLAAGGTQVQPGLAEALAAAAQEAGVELLLGAEAAEIRQTKDRVAGLALADGREIEARAVLSTLDLKRTFLTLFTWASLPKPVTRRVAGLRTSGATARLLLALDKPPALDADALRAPIHVAPDAAGMADSAAAWRAHIVPENPPLTLRVVSATAPSLAPQGKAVLTATLGAIPFRVFDGAWTHERRDRLREATLDAIERVLPGTRAAVLAADLLVPPDIEEALGASDGDLMGGEIAPDQMFAMRPGFDTPAPRTPIAGLYLAGLSSAAGPLGTGVSGAIAAAAMIADLSSGRRK